jgi:fermentation-respiration switch protein FrsA (DUF1100 family)
VQRSDLTFQSGGALCAAWLYRPEGSGHTPCVILAHGFSAVREQRLDAYAERFAQAGIAALVFDYRHFGASGGEPRQLLDIGHQVEDWHAAIAHARRLEGIDPQRIALFGTSFSGGHVLRVAADDRRVAAVVGQCPFVDGLVALPLLGLRNVARLTLAGLRDQVGAWLGRCPYTIPAVGDPGDLAAMTTPDARPGFAAMTPPRSSWRNEVAARILLHLAAQRPVRRASEIACPVLLCLCEGDTLAPGRAVVKAARAAPRGELKRYATGHFDIYVGVWFEQAVADQCEFLRRHLLEAEAGAPRRAQAGGPAAAAPPVSHQHAG